MRLAWRNLVHDKVRFFVTIVGIAFAVFLMSFEGSLLFGFLKASSKIIDSIDADIWITARGAPCLDFASPLPKRFRDLAFGVPGIVSIRQAVSGTTFWQKPSGLRQAILLVGAEAGVGKEFPLAYLPGSETTTLPERVVIDRSNRKTLEIDKTPVNVEIAKQRAIVASFTDGFGSFLGSPYVFANYDDAANYLYLSPQETMFLLVKIAPGQNATVVQQKLKEKIPEADIWLKQEFSNQARSYWLTQTGAGGSISMAALLGFLVGFVIVSQTIYATTMENIEEFATLKAIGATNFYILKLVLIQAVTSGLVGSCLGIVLANVLIKNAQKSIPWIYSPNWLPYLMIILSIIMCSFASIVSIKKALSVEPGRVFRA